MSIKIWKNDKWIDVSGAPDMSPYQKKLVAGTGITIDEQTNTISADGLEDGNVGYDTDTETLYVKVDGVYQPIAHIKGFIEDLGKEQYSGEPYHFPFNFDAKLEDNKIKVHLDTITLDNNKTIVHYDKELALPVIDVTKAYVDTENAKKQNKVVYSSTEPSEAQENDIWLF